MPSQNRNVGPQGPNDRHQEGRFLDPSQDSSDAPAEGSRNAEMTGTPNGTVESTKSGAREKTQSEGVNHSGVGPL